MWTPSDIEADYPLANDRPYAGYLHTEINYLSLTADQAVRYNFTIGATGESSLSEKAQEIVHGITGSTDPQGWDYQIDDEIAFSVGYRAFNKLMRSEGQKTQWEITNVNDINAGNFRSDVSQGVMFRWGTNLANSIGAANISVESLSLPVCLRKIPLVGLSLQDLKVDTVSTISPLKAIAQVFQAHQNLMM